MKLTLFLFSIDLLNALETLNFKLHKCLAVNNNTLKFVVIVSLIINVVV